MSERPFVPLNCFFKGSYNSEYEKVIQQVKIKCHKYNQLCPSDDEGHKKILQDLIGKLGKNATFVPPFWCDYGYNIEVGDFFYANHNCIIQDGAKVTFGESVFIAPNCTFTTAEHAIDPDMRKDGVEIAKPITIGNNVWIGTGATILAGVTIGDHAVIGAGSVVTKDIPANVIAVGVPCKVLREITEADKHTYPYFEGYQKEPSCVDK